MLLGQRCNDEGSTSYRCFDSLLILSLEGARSRESTEMMPSVNDISCISDVIQRASDGVEVSIVQAYTAPSTSERRKVGMIETVLHDLAVIGSRITSDDTLHTLAPIRIGMKVEIA